MLKLLLLLTVCSCAYGAIIAENRNCPDPSKAFNTCGQRCPASCDDDHGIPCTSECVPGCFCKDNLVLQFGRYPQISACIPRSSCPVPSTLSPTTLTVTGLPSNVPGIPSVSPTTVTGRSGAGAHRGGMVEEERQTECGFHTKTFTMKTGDMGIRYPDDDRFLLDFCFARNDDCGEEAAKQFCKRNGYDEVLRFQPMYNIRGTGVFTKHIGGTFNSERDCNFGRCNGFHMIECQCKTPNSFF